MKMNNVQHVDTLTQRYGTGRYQSMEIDDRKVNRSINGGIIDYG